jgi:hypothetical protein
MTWQQRERQKREHRDEEGRYAQVNPCYRCGKSAGADYFSGPYVDRGDPTGRSWGDQMLCTCEPCANYLHKLGPEEIAAEVDSKLWGRLPKGKRGAVVPVLDCEWERGSE